MATGTRYRVVLSDHLRSSLESLARSRTAPARGRRNAIILLGRADHRPVTQVMVAAGCSRDTVCRVCRLFCHGGWEEVDREAPRGAPWSHPETDRRDVLSWAQTDPQALGLPVTLWSLAWLQVLWRRRKTTPPPSRETLRRWLRVAQICWFAVHSFCRSTDPCWLAKAELVCDAYLSAPPQWAVLCYDQKPHLQALSRSWPTRYARAGHAGQEPHDYTRHGTTCLHALYDVRSGQALFACRPDHQAVTIAALLNRWLRTRRERQAIVILDNLSANHAPAVQEALSATGRLVLVCPVPTYSSWLNQVERVFADLQRELLDHGRADSVGHLEAQLRAWTTERNAAAAPYHWTYRPGPV